MFNIVGSKSIFNRAEIEKVIIEGDSVTIAFREGYEENEAFVPVGSDHVTLTGAKAAAYVAGLGEEKDQAKVIQKATADAAVLVALDRAPVVAEKVIAEEVVAEK